MGSVPRLSMEDRVRVVALHGEGKSCIKTGQKMKVAGSTVQAIVKKHREWIVDTISSKLSGLIHY